MWGVLRGDVDNFGIRIRRVQTIEEHVQLSVLYKQFFAGELEVLCSMPRVLAQGDAALLGRRRLRGVWRLGRADRASRASCSACSSASRRAI